MIPQKFRKGIDDALNANGLQDRTGVGGSDGDHAHSSGVRGLDTANGVFEDGTVRRNDAKERRRAKIAVGRGLRLAVLVGSTMQLK